MENCLVTKLKGVVNNDNLHVLGMMDVIVNNARCAVRTTPNSKIYVKGGTLDGQTEFTTKISGNLDTNKVVVSDGTYGEGNILLTIPRYGLSSLTALTIDAADLAYTPILYLDVKNITNAHYLSDIFGYSTFTRLNMDSATLDENLDLTELGSNGVMTQVYFGGSIAKLSGSLDKLGMSPLTTIAFPGNKNVSFSVENFVAYNRGAGRTTGEKNLPWVGACNATFNGSAITNKASNPLSWTATTITFDGTTIENSSVLPA